MLPSSLGKARLARGGSLVRFTAATTNSSSQTCALLASTRTIIVPKQLKAYGGTFSQSIGERNDHLASHLTLSPLNNNRKTNRHTSLLARPVKTKGKESFDSIVGLSDTMLSVVHQEFELEIPSPIQQIGMETILEDKNVLLLSPPGSGKTLAYLVPLFQKILNDKTVYKIPLRERRPRMIVLSNSRENVDQVTHTCNRISQALLLLAQQQQQQRQQQGQASAASFSSDFAIKTIGYTSRKRSHFHINRILKNKMADVVVMDPQMILKLIRSRRLFIDDLRYLVVDEADLLLSSQFDHFANILISKIQKRNLYQYLWPVQTQYVVSSAFMTRKLEYFLGGKFKDAAPPLLTAGSENFTLQTSASPESKKKKDNIIYNNSHIDNRVVPCFIKGDMHKNSPSLVHRFMAVQRTEEKKDLVFHLLRKHGHQRVITIDSSDKEELVQEANSKYSSSSTRRGQQNSSEREKVFLLSDTLEDWRDRMNLAYRQNVGRHSMIAGGTTESHDDGVSLRTNTGLTSSASVGQAAAAAAAASTPSPSERRMLEKCQPLQFHHLTTERNPGPFLTPHQRVVFAPGERTIIFFDTIDSVTAFYYYIRNEGYAVSILHGLLPFKKRKEEYRNFCEGRTNILVATDVAARGVDLPASIVINFHLPSNPITYLSRSGRIGRMNRRGIVYNLYHHKRDKTVASALRLFTQQRYNTYGTANAVTPNFSDTGINKNNEAAMVRPRYAEWRAQRINSLAKSYVSLITKKTIPYYLERTYVRHNATWRPLYHPKTLDGTKNSHGGIPVRQQLKIMNRVMESAVEFRKAQLAARKGGRAKFGSRMAKMGVWNDVGGAVGHVSGHNVDGVSSFGIPSGPPTD